MKVYLSKSSKLVKLITIGLLMCSTIIVLLLLVSNENYGITTGIILSLIIIGTLTYFYSNSLKKIIIDGEKIILEKNIGEIKINISEIKEIQKLEYSNLTMTFGSKGVFGYIGNTMDDSVSLVKDRKNMIKIITLNKNYIFSAENPNDLITEIKKTQHNIG